MSRSDRVLRLAYAGDDSFVTCLHALLDRDDIEFVVCLTADDRRYTETVDAYAAGRGARVIRGNPRQGGWAGLAEDRIDLLVSAAYGYRIPVETLAIETMINVHPSYLPHGRGPNPLVHLAGAGDQQVDVRAAAGVTLHLLDETFDTGPILLQQHFDGLAPEPSLTDLTMHALAVAPTLLNQVLDQLEMHIENALPQIGGSYWPMVGQSQQSVDLAMATGKEIAEVVHRFSCQGFALRLGDGSNVWVKNAHFTPAQHGFEPGVLLGRLRGDYILSTTDGLVRGVPFSDES